jgi:hypothetical protein
MNKQEVIEIVFSRDYNRKAEGDESHTILDDIKNDLNRMNYKDEKNDYLDWIITWCLEEMKRD